MFDQTGIGVVDSGQMALAAKVQRGTANNQQEIEERQEAPGGDVAPAEQPEQTPAFAKRGKDSRSGEEKKARDAEEQADAIPDPGNEQRMAAAVEQAKKEQVDGQGKEKYQKDQSQALRL